jgi:hypothetical protein
LRLAMSERGGLWNPLTGAVHEAEDVIHALE